ncbi:DUF1624 domain-containing protein [Clostridium sp. SHJSY1]|uniref:heparan-alpha-glucosaminide N-acetyltransferase n=1 Tax=Clostridium sp. SHJSY1 TaxID=2942483 RepID=UPI002875418C|nr:heparan-alpha-glucosaminide N-acetyltransferase [Clostridium sp. SHJSY1]MDS0524543.1 DUF1624 domain-containing protein [Clostridium sp. SHJSY1]
MYKRIDLIDEFRGAAIILMITYHFFYQGVLWGTLDSKLLDNQIIEAVRLSSEVLFISIAGISSSFSKNNYKRGLICLYCGILITFTTYFFIPDELISFGILHFLGISMILYELFKNKLKKIKPLNGIVISLMFFTLTYLIFYKEVYLNDLLSVYWINYLRNNGYLNIIGLTSNTFISSDYFPMIPWIFLFFTGVFAGKIIKSVYKIKENLTTKLNILAYLGRHSLMIYMTHIPIIIGIVLLLQYI